MDFMSFVKNPMFDVSFRIIGYETLMANGGSPEPQKFAPADERGLLRGLTKGLTGVRGARAS